MFPLGFEPTVFGESGTLRLDSDQIRWCGGNAGLPIHFFKTEPAVETDFGESQTSRCHGQSHKLASRLAALMTKTIVM